MAVNVGKIRRSGEDKILDDMLQRLIETFNPERVYLFGSRARGTWDQHSDYDFLVVISHSPLSLSERAVIAIRALAKAAAPKDVIVLTQEEFEHGLSVPATLPATVVREGILLYER